MAASVSTACAPPAKPPEFPYTSTSPQTSPVSAVATDLPGVDYYVDGQPTSHPHLDLGLTQLRLIKAAFSCDLARVATFMWASGTSWVVFPGTFQGATVGRWSHLRSSPRGQPDDDAGTEDWLSQIDQFYSGATSTVLAGARDDARTSTATC